MTQYAGETQKVVILKNPKLWSGRYSDEHFIAIVMG